MRDAEKLWCDACRTGWHPEECPACELRDAFAGGEDVCARCGWSGDLAICRQCGKPGEHKDLAEFVVPTSAKEEDRAEPVPIPMVRPVLALHGMLGVDDDHKPTLVEIEALFRLVGITRTAERWTWIRFLGVITSARAMERQRQIDQMTSKAD